MMDGGFHQRRPNAQECAASFCWTIKKKQKKTETVLEDRKMGGWRWSQTVGGARSKRRVEGTKSVAVWGECRQAGVALQRSSRLGTRREAKRGETGGLSSRSALNASPRNPR
uniref:Uncharacterized protein n=1 Tax=Plectus sambesii TaxID=2011161 RepID=A0A914WNH8_9BILA